MFKKIRKFYRNNRIYSILMIISMFCILLMGTCVIVYFVNQMNKSPYGDRLDKIEEHDLGKSLKELENYYKDQGVVSDVNVRLQGKTIMITGVLSEDVIVDELQNVSTSGLEIISEDNRSYYEMQLMFKVDDVTSIAGSKNANATVITWRVYYNEDEEDEEETTTTTTTKKK